MRDNSRSSFYNYSAQSPESPWPIQTTPRRFHSNKIGFLPDKDRTEVTASVCFPFSPRDLPTGQTLLCNQHQKYDILKGSHQEHNITSAKFIRCFTLHSFVLFFLLFVLSLSPNSSFYPRTLICVTFSRSTQA